MNVLYPMHRLLLRKMVEKEVDFILAGGYAVNYHRYNRVSGDIDIWVRPDNESKKSLLSALRDLDFDDEGLAVLNDWDFTKPQLFHIGKAPDLTDFMTFIAGIGYGEAKQSAVHTTIEDTPLRIIHLQHLIRNKTASGRLKGLSDVEYLTRIFNLQQKKP